MSGEGRAPGWYPDPWGTDDERWFDGGAWARATRQPGGLATPPGPDDSTASSGGGGLDAPALGSAPGPPVPAPEVPAGWHPDPWGTAALRWWDGRQWTGYVSGMHTGPSAVMRLDAERGAARWARIGLLWGGPALGARAIASAYQARWIADHWDELTRPGSSQAFAPTGTNPVADAVGQVALLALIVAAVLFLVWFYRAASLAASAGIAARRSPVLATVSFIIPILSLWWPYQSTCDLFPPGHPARALVRRWWALWIGCTVGGIAVFVSAFVDDVALAIAAACTVVLALLTAIAARIVVADVVAAHDELATRAATV